MTLRKASARLVCCLYVALSIGEVRTPPSSKIDANTYGPSFAYTDAGRLSVRTWARGSPRITSTYTYGNLGDLTGVTYLDGTSGPSYGFDRRGRRTQCVLQGMTTTKQYDNLNHFWSISSAPAGTPAPAPLAYNYQYSDANQWVRVNQADERPLPRTLVNALDFPAGSPTVLP